MADDILLDVRDLRVSFGPVRAVDGVSLAISRGPFGIALVGESGSGKTTVGRAILRLVPASAGTIAFDGQDVLGLRGPCLRAYRRAVQIVFLYNLFWSYFHGKASGGNPWRATTLEWQTPETPPKHGNFGKELPVVYRWAYDYSVPGAPDDFIPQNQPPGRTRSPDAGTLGSRERTA